MVAMNRDNTGRNDRQLSRSSFKHLVSLVFRQCRFWRGRRYTFANQQAVTLNSAPENWHESFIEHLASILKPRVYVELGLYRCELFNRIISHAQRLIGVDINAEVGIWMAKSDKVQFVHSTTDEFAAGLRAHPMLIDMLFIDADHSREAVLRDFWNFFPFVSPHGIIILHDTHPKNSHYAQPGYCGDAYKAVEELSRHTDKFEMMTIPVHPGLTLLRKRTAQLSWVVRG